jgi:uncharacterized protein (DUF1778 family)
MKQMPDTIASPSKEARLSIRVNEAEKRILA